MSVFALSVGAFALSVSAFALSVSAFALSVSVFSLSVSHPLMLKADLISWMSTLRVCVCF